MQELSTGFALSVERITDDGQTQVGQVNADLMSASGSGLDPQKGVHGAAPLDEKSGVRVERIGVINLFGRRRDVHFGTAASTSEQRQRHIELIVIGTAGHQREVFFFDQSTGKVGAELGPGRRGLGKQQCATCVRVEPMTDPAFADGLRCRRARWKTGNHGIGDGSSLAAPQRMAGLALRFGHHHHVGVFIQNHKRQIRFGHWRRRYIILCVFGQRHRLTGQQRHALFADPAIDLHQTVGDEPHCRAATDPRMGCDEPIQSLICSLCIYQKLPQGHGVLPRLETELRATAQVKSDEPPARIEVPIHMVLELEAEAEHRV